jgi:hypothetical protein
VLTLAATGSQSAAALESPVNSPNILRGLQSREGRIFEFCPAPVCAATQVNDLETGEKPRAETVSICRNFVNSGNVLHSDVLL